MAKQLEITNNMLIIYRVIKKNLDLCFRVVLCKYKQIKLYVEFLRMNSEYTFFSFYKPKSIFKTMAAFGGKSFSKDMVLYKKNL